MNKDKALARWYQYQLRARKMELNYCTKEEFSKFWHGNEKKCCYCGIPEHLIKEAYPNIRIKVITVDRKDSSVGYEIDNICFACFPCNMIKSFFLSHEQMKEVGQKYMAQKWLDFQR
jgi:hypothetical protein